MKRLFPIFIIVFMYTLVGVNARAETGKTLLETKIEFEGPAKGKVVFNPSKNDNETNTNKIQSALIFYAYAMNQMPEAERVKLMNQVQRSISKVATNHGLVRADLLKNNPFMESLKEDSQGKGFVLIFGTEPGQGNSLEVKPMADSLPLMGPAVFYFFQDMVNNLPEGGVRLMVLGLGGMNKWYREIGKATDENSISQAPTYGLNLAVDIISKISGKKI